MNLASLTTQELVKLAVLSGKEPKPLRDRDIYWYLNSFTTPESPHQLHCSARNQPVFSPGCSCRYKFRETK